MAHSRLIEKCIARKASYSHNNFDFYIITFQFDGVLRDEDTSPHMSKAGKNPEKTVEVCPICGSSDLYYEMGGYTGKIYHCKNCNYKGPLIVEADSEMIKAIKEDYEQNKKKGQ